MDVIVEGSINQDESMAEVINSVVAIKSCQTPILRINDNQSELQGRLLFSAGGFILGAKINATGESGYSAVRKLLLVSDGNYAILDPVRKPTAELNQGLWLATAKLVPMLPNLPEAPKTLVDPHPERITESAARPKTGQLDLAPHMSAVNAPKDQPLVDPSIPTTVEKEDRQTVGSKQASRKYNEGRWRTIKFMIQVFGSLLVTVLIMQNSDYMYTAVYKGFKAFGVDIDASRALTGPLSSFVDKARADREAKAKKAEQEAARKKARK
jgi:hypothetical protein